MTFQDEESRGRRLYRNGRPSPSNLKVRDDEDCVSFRYVLSNPYPCPEGRPVLPSGDTYMVIDVSLLPPNCVIYDDDPAGHACVHGVNFEVLKSAVVDRPKFP